MSYARGESVDRRQKQAILQQLAAINQDFCNNRQAIYEEKIQEVNDMAQAICAGTDPKYREKVVELGKMREEAIFKAKLLCDYQLASAHQLYVDEVRRAEEDYANEKEELREKLRSGIEERLRRLKDDKDIMDIAQEIQGEGGSRSNSKRNLRKRGPDQTDQKTGKKKNPPSVTLSHAVPEEDALDDLAQMKK
ncbi:hypothetical protein IWQ60_006116, partial [Tieghemiomyces parasiticus]